MKGSFRDKYPGAPKPDDSNWKVCNTCGERKPLVHYARNKTSKGGFMAKCKACAKKALSPAVAAKHKRYLDNKKESFE